MAEIIATLVAKERKHWGMDMCDPKALALPIDGAVTNVLVSISEGYLGSTQIDRIDIT